jgi:ketosteroid isomerase-like protein
MASANMDLVRSIFAAIERGDYRKAEWADPRIEYVIADGPEPGSFTGLAGMAEVMRVIFSAFDDLRDEAEGLRELDAERVLVLTRASGRGKTWGMNIEQRGAQLFEIHDGKVTRLVNYFDRDHAFADLGLTPEVD